jgi:hypothetical protein
MYPSCKTLLLGGDIDLLNDTIKVVAIDTADYTYNSAHDFLNDVAAGSRIATATLASKTISGGVFDAADVTFTSVTGDPFEALILYKDTGVESTSPLIAYLDSGFVGLPFTPSGGDITLGWNASGIISL